MIAPQNNDEQGNARSGNSNTDAQEGYFVSPDGLLAITIVRDIDEEELIGFHGFDWSVQVSVLSELSGVSLAEARENFLRDIFEDKSVIAILRCHGEISDVWVTDDPKMDQKFLKVNEQIFFRFWSGTRVEICDGST